MANQPTALPPNLLEMSKEELIALLAQTLLANQQLQAQLTQLLQRPDGRSLRWRRSDDDAPVDWTKVKKTCSRCRQTKPVVPGFGLVTYRSGKQGANGYCKDCRSKTSGEYRRKQRKQNSH